MRRLTATLTAAVICLLSATATAYAGDGGEGWYGETDDKVVTFFGLGLVVLFPLIAAVMSLLQGRLERRKEQRLEATLNARRGR